MILAVYWLINWLNCWLIVQLIYWFRNNLLMYFENLNLIMQELSDTNNYHEFCRLLARLKSNYQLGELVTVDNYPVKYRTNKAGVGGLGAHIGVSCRFQFLMILNSVNQGYTSLTLSFWLTVAWIYVSYTKLDIIFWVGCRAVY